MSVIEGKAKKYDGTPIDYVSIFNWADGKCIDQVVPDAAGNWEFVYSIDIIIGVTYVADGCEPITHGPYNIVVDTESISSGYLILKMCHVSTYNPVYDVSASTEPTWEANFAQTVDIGLFGYVTGSTPLLAPKETVVIGVFDINWRINMWGWNASGSNDEHLLEFEVLDSLNNVLFALRSTKDGPGSAGLWYGPSFDNLGKAPQSGDGVTSGVLSFKGDRVEFVRDREADYNDSFVFLTDLSQASKIRLSAYASAQSPSYKYANASAYMRVIPPD